MKDFDVNKNISICLISSASTFSQWRVLSYLPNSMKPFPSF